MPRLNNQPLNKQESPLNFHYKSLRSSLKNHSSPPNFTNKGSTHRKLFLNPLDSNSEIQEPDANASSTYRAKTLNNDSITLNQAHQNSNKNMRPSTKQRTKSFGELLKTSESEVHTMESEYQMGKTPKLLTKKSSLPLIYKTNKPTHQRDLFKTKINFNRTNVKLFGKEDHQQVQKTSELNLLLLKLSGKQKLATQQKLKEQNILRIYSSGRNKEKEEKEHQKEVLMEYQLKKGSSPKLNLEKKKLKVSLQRNNSPLAYTHKSHHHSAKKSSKY